MMLKMTTAAVVMLLALSGVRAADFVPGCSFVGGQCQYSVQLGHAGQCDSVTTSSGTTADDPKCCETVKADMQTVRSDIDLLQSQVKGLMNDLTQARSDLSQAQTRANQTEAERDALLATLSQKEAELNTTQKEMANLIHRTGAEITALRSELANMTAQADTCRAALGLPATDPQLSSSLGGPVSQTYCNFSSNTESPCKWQLSSTSVWKLETKESSSGAGPAADHSQGSVSGKYLSMDGYQAARSYSSSSSNPSPRSYTAISEEFQPANAYCIMFYYSMVGIEVQQLKATIKIGGGIGYPVWSDSGRKQSDWLFGQFELDSEYTANPFSVEFIATTKGYTRYNSVYNEDADIGIDDLYAYNTTCDQVPKCPVNSVHRNTISNRTSCYTFHAGALSWEDAYYTCRKESPWSALVSVESKQEQEYLVGVIAGDQALTSAGQYGFYTSGNDLKTEHQFVWTNTGTGRPVTNFYENWHTGQPNNVGGAQDCLLLEYARDDYSWGDVDCKSAHPFICESSYDG